MADLTPRPQDKFTFGLWTVGHRGNDPFGVETRPGVKPAQRAHRPVRRGDRRLER